MRGEDSGPEAGPQSKNRATNRATLRPEIIRARRRQWEWQLRCGHAMETMNGLRAGESRRCAVVDARSKGLPGGRTGGLFSPAGGCGCRRVHNHPPRTPRTRWWRGLKMGHSGRIGNRRRLAGTRHPLSQQFLSHDPIELRPYLLDRNAPRSLFGDSQQVHAGSG